jgi:hypothetical protein
MVPDLFFYQLAVFVLVWLFVLLHQKLYGFHSLTIH